MSEIWGMGGFDQIWQLNSLSVSPAPGMEVFMNTVGFFSVFSWLLCFVNKEKLQLCLPTVQLWAAGLWEPVVRRGLRLSVPALGQLHTEPCWNCRNNHHIQAQSTRTHTHTHSFATCYWPHYKEKRRWRSAEHSSKSLKKGTSLPLFYWITRTRLLLGLFLFCS